MANTVQIINQLYSNQFAFKQFHFTETALLINFSMMLLLIWTTAKLYRLRYLICQPYFTTRSYNGLLLSSGFRHNLTDRQLIVTIAKRIQVIILTQCLSYTQRIWTCSVVELMVNKLYLFQMKRRMNESTNTWTLAGLTIWTSTNTTL